MACACSKPLPGYWVSYTASVVPQAVKIPKGAVKVSLYIDPTGAPAITVSWARGNAVVGADVVPILVGFPINATDGRVFNRMGVPSMATHLVINSNLPRRGAVAFER